MMMLCLAICAGLSSSIISVSTNTSFTMLCTTMSYIYYSEARFIVKKTNVESNTYNDVQLILCDTECQFQKSMRLYRSGRNWLQDSVRLKWGQCLEVAGLFIKVTSLG